VEKKEKLVGLPGKGLPFERYKMREERGPGGTKRASTGVVLVERKWCMSHSHPRVRKEEGNPLITKKSIKNQTKRLLKFLAVASRVGKGGRGV